MRIPKSLSYSALALFESDRDEFFLKYLSSHKAQRLPQNNAAAVGSSFDAYVKSALHTVLFGPGSDPQFEFQTIFESQVESQCRDFALDAGKRVFDAYKFCGAYDYLLTLLRQSVEPPRFEFSVEGLINGVPFLGKPDCRFVLDLGQGRVSCVWDFKVKGYCSKYGASPSKGYMTCLDGFAGKPSRSAGKQHNMFLAMDYRGLPINSGYLEFCNAEYADQLTTYGWLLGERIGDENVVLGIEELVAKFMGEDNPPTLRYARHRGRVKSEYQKRLAERIAHCWAAITTGYVFTEMTREQSDAHCQMLEEMAVGLMSDGSDLDKWFSETTRARKF